MTLPLRINMSAKTFALGNHVPNNVLYAKLKTAQYFDDYTTVGLS